MILHNATTRRRLPARTAALMLLLGGLIVYTVGCSTVAVIGESAGVLTGEQAGALVKAGEGFGQALKQITPDQEYYVGRSVGASIVNSYKVYENPTASHYLNVVGQALAMASDKPETYGGYHYLILDSNEINAFAAPGGFIFVSRGMLRLCQDEDDLAAVLAHEVAHVNLGHAIAAISNSRWTSAFAVLGTEGAKTFGGSELSQLTTAFEGSIQDVTGKLVTSGYARSQERDADALAVKILKRVGYDPGALPRVLARMGKELKPGGLDFAKTHPPPQSRISDLAKSGVKGVSAPQPVRQARYARAMRDV